MEMYAGMKHSTMARVNKNKPITTNKRFLIVVLLFVLGIISFFVIRQWMCIETADKIFAELTVWVPDASWSKKQPATEQTPYGELKGWKSYTTVTTEKASFSHFEDPTFLATLGFQPDMNLSADGPGSSMWGYSREILGKKQYAIFSYHTQPTSTKPDEPLQFDCPCQTTLSTFVSN